MKYSVQEMTGLTSLGLLVADKVGSGATQLDRKMAFNYILGVTIGALSARFPDQVKETEPAKGKSPSVPLKDKGEEKPKRKYTRRAKKENSPATGETKKRGVRGKNYNVGIKTIRGRSAAEADAAIREMEKKQREARGQEG